ncbi:type IV secretion system DNA-binding domain-containing protein [Halococcus sp. PRR34]|uniref:type IV secretion system DNA-binding domain-containing protein n=2 Tax=Halobacteriales TaxID=2235 RepID=UPI00235EB1E0|nr:type IV secretion system DNA-binding domain-containing protein [Halococcus sp. PRR34]
MPFLSRIHRSNKMTFARAATLSESTAEQFQGQAEGFDSPIYKLQPYHGENGVEEAVNLLEGLFHYQTKFGVINNSETHAFEMWFDGERTTYHYIPEDVATGENFHEQITEDYPHTNVRQSFESVPDGMFQADHALAGARFNLMRDPTYPIKSIENGGFGTRNRGNTRDPYKDLIGPFTRDDDSRIMFQLVFYPVKRGWLRRKRVNRRAEALRGEHAELLHSRDATKQEKEAARVIEEQKNRDIFGVEMRMLVSAPTEDRALNRLESLTSQIESRYRTNLNQRFYASPASSYLPGWNGRAVRDLAKSVVTRDLDRKSSIECTPEELAGLAHLPSDDVQNQHIDWTNTRAGDPVPIGTPRFDWEGENLNPIELTPHEKQDVLLSSSYQDSPYWLGRGARKATEAGIHPEQLKLHMFVGGSTGFGKTTLLKNLFTQMIRRDYGALFYDPKADDARDFVSMVPEDRRDDLVYIEIGGNREQTVGFNFLEIPGNPDPESAQFAESVEAMADDIEALVSQAGGSDEYWGPRMSRVVRNMARGMAKSGRNLTLLDMYYALIDERGRQEYAEHLSDERIEWIVDYASRQLADMDDSDIEPLIGRLQQWVESDLMRSIVSHPESTFSVEEAVAEGKIIVVRDMTSTGGTAGTLIATALIRRVWSAVQKLQDDEEREDPPMFYSILDEFDKIVSGQSSIAEILSLARAYNLSIIPACQDLTNQLRGEEGIQDAILGQCQTFANFNPQRHKEAQTIVTRHSDEVSASDLTNLPQYQFYMRNRDDNGEFTYSYKVNGFPPIDEVLDEQSASEEEVDAMIERSLEQYATERMTSQEIRDSSEFRSGGDADPEAIAAGLDSGKDEDTRQRDELFAAVERAQVRNDMIGEFVHHEKVREAWATIADGNLGYLSETANQIEEADDEYLEQQRQNNEVHARLTPEGREVAGLVQNTGSSGSGGGLDHRWVLSQSKLAYERMGYVVSLPTQDEEGELPDGVAIMPVDPTEAETVGEMHDLENQLKTEFGEVYEYSEGRDVSIEAETSTITKPMQTMTNLRKAMDAKMKCVFTTKDGSYDEDSEAAEEIDHASLFEYWARRGERIMYDDDLDNLIFAREQDDDDNRWFYNKSKQFTIEEDPDLVALRPANESGSNETVWRDDGDEIVLADDLGEIHARFSGPKDIADPPREDFPAYYEYDKEEEGNFHVQLGGESKVYQTKDELQAEWTPVKEPFVPGVEFTDEHGEPNTPTEDDFEFVIFPDANNDEYDEPMIYEQGEVTRPLLPKEMNMPSSVVERDPDEVDTESEGESEGAGDVESEESPAAKDSNDGTTDTTAEAEATASEGSPPGDSTTSEAEEGEKEGGDSEYVSEGVKAEDGEDVEDASDATEGGDGEDGGNAEDGTLDEESASGDEEQTTSEDESTNQQDEEEGNEKEQQNQSDQLPRL